MTANRSATSPYLRVAEDIRSRIARGEIAVGDRAPTTREVAKQWKVAMATAARALGVLADQGVIRVVPRVGSIVARPRAAAARETREVRERGERELTAARIVEGAIRVADEEGLDALSLRAVASKVGAPVMSLYRHVRSKDDLLRLMTDAALAREPLPAAPPKGWRAQLEVAARAEWCVFRQHPWLARVVNLTRPEPLPSAISFADWVFRALEETRLSAGEKMRMHVLLHSYVQGLAVNVEAEANAAGETGMSNEEWMHQRGEAFSRMAASGKYPAFARVVGELGDFEIEFESLFEHGLKTMLDGFEKGLG
jgi:DNA-binding transcriptional regulator YhcF (GntR family)